MLGPVSVAIAEGADDHAPILPMTVLPMTMEAEAAGQRRGFT
jgi:hypothetical protein